MSRPHYITPEPEEVLPIFRAAARASDPVTSHQAAAEAVDLAEEHRAKILDALVQGPAGASTIAARCGLIPHQIGRRLSELERAGRIVLTGRTVRSASGRGEREWRRKE